MTISELPLKIIADKVRDALANVQPAVKTGELIMQAVSDACGLAVSDLTGPFRPTLIAVPRMASMALCRRFTPLPFEQIAAMHGKRDHSTAIYADRKCNRFREFRDLVESIEEKSPTPAGSGLI